MWMCVCVGMRNIEMPTKLVFLFHVLETRFLSLPHHSLCVIWKDVTIPNLWHKETIPLNFLIDSPAFFLLFFHWQHFATKCQQCLSCLVYVILFFFALSFFREVPDKKQRLCTFNVYKMANKKSKYWFNKIKWLQEIAIHTPTQIEHVKYILLKTEAIVYGKKKTEHNIRSFLLVCNIYSGRNRFTFIHSTWFVIIQQKQRRRHKKIHYKVLIENLEKFSPSLKFKCQIDF